MAPITRYQRQKAEMARKQMQDDDFMRMMIYSLAAVALIFFCGGGYAVATRGSILKIIFLFLVSMITGFYSLGMTLAWGGL